MKVRGWLIAGGDVTASTLPPEMSLGTVAALPEANECEVGQWCMWWYAIGLHVCCVCVEIPIP
jgi:hypothetical protein